MGMKCPNWVRNDQIENKSGYEMTKMVRNDLGTKWPGYEMTGYQQAALLAFEVHTLNNVLTANYKLLSDLKETARGKKCYRFV